MDIHPRLKKIIFDKLNSDLEDFIFLPNGRETWIINFDDKSWCFSSDCYGQIHYNSNFFNSFFRLFSFEQNEYQPLLKDWYGNLTSQNIRVISRRSGSFDYLIEHMLKKNSEWSLLDRYGWSYQIVKKYLDMKKNLNKKYICVGDLN
jgi:hypothetical protein